MSAAQAVSSLFGPRAAEAPVVSTTLDESVRGNRNKFEDLDLHKDVHGSNEEALQVLAADFGNNALGSQASKQADSYEKGKRVITMREMSNIVMEEVRHLADGTALVFLFTTLSLLFRCDFCFLFSIT